MIILVKNYAFICSHCMYIGFNPLPEAFFGPFQPLKSDGSTNVPGDQPELSKCMML